MRLALAMAMLAACGRSDANDMMAAPGRSAAMSRNADMGSAMRGSGMASVGEPLTKTWTGPGAAPPPPKTTKELVAGWQACWAHFNAHDVDKLAACYAPTAVLTLEGLRTPPPNLVGPESIRAQLVAEKPGSSDIHAEPDLVIVGNRDLVAIVLVTGTHDGVFGAGPEAKSGGYDMPLREVPATNKKFGGYVAQVATFDDPGRIDTDRRFFDYGMTLAQLGITKAAARAIPGPFDKQLLPSSAGGILYVRDDDAAARANLAAHGRFDEALNRHDAAGVADMLADDMVWSEQAQPSDWTKKEYAAHLASLWRSYSDLRFAVLKTWAAGDYVVAIESFTGHNDGELPGPKGGNPIPKTGASVALPTLAVYRFTHGQEKPKIAAAWTFYQSGGLAAQLVKQPPKKQPKKGR